MARRFYGVERGFDRARPSVLFCGVAFLLFVGFAVLGARGRREWTPDDSAAVTSGLATVSSGVAAIASVFGARESGSPVAPSAEARRSPLVRVDADAAEEAAVAEEARLALRPTWEALARAGASQTDDEARVALEFAKGVIRRRRAWCRHAVELGASDGTIRRLLRTWGNNVGVVNDEMLRAEVDADRRAADADRQLEGVR